MPVWRCLQRREGPPDRCLVTPRAGTVGKRAMVSWGASQAYRIHSPAPILSVAGCSHGCAPAGLRGDIVAPNACYLRHDSIRYLIDVGRRFRRDGADVGTSSLRPIRRRTRGVETNLALASQASARVLMTRCQRQTILSNPQVRRRMAGQFGKDE
jgi:hypothetical protein